MNEGDNDLEVLGLAGQGRVLSGSGPGAVAGPRAVAGLRAGRLFRIAGHSIVTGRMLADRVLAEWLAVAGGYFWLPCPLCHENFAGFEWGVGSLVTDPATGSGRGVCSKKECEEEADRQSKAALGAWLLKQARTRSAK